jgi:hypothetical protein
MSFEPRCIDNADGQCSKPGGAMRRGMCSKHTGVG